ncbi:hypothetical protein DUNSADRAFT_3401 [Dunaliella salina]|uniref:Uncharacterized protein n=1 Tax=Dunaliella salina TaxID=3046 RepID=A0ABQ7GU10_DUNSA|nr:hypothetical protein DUNSADRAFT_3401 [Dunaliella salina]|eukprot:KAF5838092.1 hypothetical protein DUNSADRAFT_3401 [Dunaliella salina]
MCKSSAEGTVAGEDRRTATPETTTSTLPFLANYKLPCLLMSEQGNMHAFAEFCGSRATPVKNGGQYPLYQKIQYGHARCVETA